MWYKVKIFSLRPRAFTLLRRQKGRRKEFTLLGISCLSKHSWGLVERLVLGRTVELWESPRELEEAGRAIGVSHLRNPIFANTLTCT